ncbi:penicillin-binding transpeptidase domain-containing protein [Aquihabitans daechungensis]|uniref:penicillin-binding transpeptidase domain-containing protein n=1 Tax=Aquihabitans daechungensis TaxID=1052257 RepID=UPI003BA229C7
MVTATVDASALNHRRDNPWNRQPVSLDRGRILSADGVVLARSVRRGDTWHRDYPLGAVTAGVVGWVSRSGSLGGAELAYDAALAEGQDVRLTIVASWQDAAYRALAGRTGAAVLLDHRSGAVRVLVSTPSFDPEPLASPDPEVAATARTRLLADPANPLLIGAYQQRYAPGSIFKLVDVQAASTSALDLTEAHPVLRTWTAPEGQAIDNADGMACGGDLVRMLEVSCNTTATAVGERVGTDALRGAADQLGLHGAPAFDLPGAASTGFPTSSDPFIAALAAIGQGDVSISPLQAAVMVSAATSDEVPGLRLRDADAEDPARPAATGADPAAREVLRSGMARCIQVGTCRELQNTGARFAKTGTAQTGTSETDARRNAWIVASNDRLAASVLVVGKPGERVTGGTDAASVARAVLLRAGDGEVTR